MEQQRDVKMILKLTTRNIYIVILGSQDSATSLNTELCCMELVAVIKFTSVHFALLTETQQIGRGDEQKDKKTDLHFKTKCQNMTDDRYC